MPKYVKEPIGTLIRTRKVKTFGDKLKEWAATAGGIAIFLWFISHMGN